MTNIISSFSCILKPGMPTSNNEAANTLADISFRSPNEIAQLFNTFAETSFKLPEEQLRKWIMKYFFVLEKKDEVLSTFSDIGDLLLKEEKNLKRPDEVEINQLIQALRKLEKINPALVQLVVFKSIESKYPFIICKTKPGFMKIRGETSALGGATISMKKDRSAIILNIGSTPFNLEYLFLHELIHLIDESLVSDKGKVKTFHDLLNRGNNGILDKIAQNYKKRLTAASDELCGWISKNISRRKTQREVALLKEKTKEIFFDKYRLWATNENNVVDGILRYDGILCEKIDGAEEIFAYGLQYYIEGGSKKKRLERCEHELYLLIEKEIIPALKSLHFTEK